MVITDTHLLIWMAIQVKLINILVNDIWKCRYSKALQVPLKIQFLAIISLCPRTSKYMSYKTQSFIPQYALSPWYVHGVDWYLQTSLKLTKSVREIADS